MSKYDPEIHHRRSVRLKEYDYSQEGLYFVTICTQNRKCLFGEIVDNEMRLSNIGVIANIMWYEIKNHAKNVELREFVVMPNHIHGIIEITVDNNETNGATCRGVACNALTTDDATINENSMNVEKNEYMSFISPKSGNLATIIRSYKSAVSKYAHLLGYNFAWQRNYHEHIIRTRNSYQSIANYIKNNPSCWAEDTMYEIKTSIT